MMSDTPRTDSLIYRKNTIEMQRHELLDLALALERELAAAIAGIDEERERAQREGARVIELQVKLAEAVAKERERCAKVCEGVENSMYWIHNKRGVAQDCADAIRKGE